MWRFETTSWSVIAKAADPTSPERKQALTELCQAYWYPLYAFVRRHGYPPDAAEDLTQGFFADLLSRSALQMADPARGRFRSFLLAALEHFLANQRKREKRRKRGGGVVHFSIDFRDAEGRYRREPAHFATPERLFMRRWALTLLDLVFQRLESEMGAQDRSQLFKSLKPALIGGPVEGGYAELGAAMGMTEGAARLAAHRLRQRFRTLLNEEITRTIADPGAVDEEINQLFLALRSPTCQANP
jgi:RNA polymerase sigma-70 factor (ECF subfamily)